MGDMQNIPLTIFFQMQGKHNIQNGKIAGWGCEEYFRDSAKLVVRALTAPLEA